MSAYVKWPEVAAVLWLVFINAAAFAAFSADKRRAVRGRRRIPESRLLTLALIGGAAGSLAAMRLCRHKTRKPRFSVGIPLMLAAQLGLLVWALLAVNGG